MPREIEFRSQERRDYRRSNFKLATIALLMAWYEEQLQEQGGSEYRVFQEAQRMTGGRINMGYQTMRRFIVGFIRRHDLGE